METFTKERLDKLDKQLAGCQDRVDVYLSTVQIDTSLLNELVAAVELLQRIRMDVEYSDDARESQQFMYKVFGI